MLRPHTRESFDFGRIGEWSSPLKKKSKQPYDILESEKEDMANSSATMGGSGTISENAKLAGQFGGTLPASETCFANPVFQQNGQTNQGGHGQNAEQSTYENDFPALCRVVEVVTPEALEKEKVEIPKERVTSWKSVVEKSILERHPMWANSQSILNAPNPYTKGLKATECEDVSSQELEEVVRDINSFINVDEYKIGDTIQVPTTAPSIGTQGFTEVNHKKKNGRSFPPQNPAKTLNPNQDEQDETMSNSEDTEGEDNNEEIEDPT
ncbi:hypothetical protein R1sor_019889 [Riccia sorocarpa]|uniref:Uncharacterized protein n=1 Tax=Riccia sorocarpa TaxID=122646 RepID=A0ABD3IDY8_9MARC